MKAFIGLIENHHGKVIGATTDAGDVWLDPSEHVLRQDFAAVAAEYATKYGIQIPTQELPVIAALQPAAAADLALHPPGP